MVCRTARTVALFNAAFVISAISRAVVVWFPFRPDAFSKWVLVQPSSLALWFMSSANALCDPATFSAIPFATSQAERSSMACSASFTVMVSPTRISAVMAPLSRWLTALSVKVMVSSRPRRSAQSSAVMSLVVDAGYIDWDPFLSNRISLVVASYRTAAAPLMAGAATEEPVASVGAAADAAAGAWVFPEAGAPDVETAGPATF